MLQFIRAAVFALAAAALAATTLATIAEAQTRTRFVPVAGLDLASAAGGANLNHRIGLAARQVCGPAELFGAPDYASYVQCVDEAEAGATHRAQALIANARSGIRLAAR